MAYFKLNTRKYIDGILGVGFLLPYFFWLVPNLLESEDVSIDVAYTTIITVALLIVNSVVVSWFRLVKKVQDVEYQVTLLLLAAGLTVVTFILGMLTRNFYIAIIISVVVTYIVMYYRCANIMRDKC